MPNKLLFSISCALILGFAVLLAAQTNDDEAAIRAIDAKWQKAAATRDVRAMIDCYTDDAIMMEPGAPPFVGKQAIREQWLRELSDNALVLTWSIAALEVRGDMAFTRGRYDITYTNENRVVDEVGKYVTVWKKVGKDWKVATEIYNADGPPKPHI